MPESQMTFPESRFLIRRILCELEGAGVTILHPKPLEKALIAQHNELEKLGVPIANQNDQDLEKVLADAQKDRLIVESKQCEGYPIYFGFTMWKNADRLVLLNGSGEAVKAATAIGVWTYLSQERRNGKSVSRS